ncbi:hypothetical protein GCM10009742_16170 [Kribbella karoonensis]|uniref:Uncharacterized protein n=1 Tax=Kribbella karoonensis TaxID=324851 RepID=A0ABN2DDB8_9ACTN
MTFASTSLARHVARGVLGFGSLIAAFALIPAAGALSLLLLPVALAASATRLHRRSVHAHFPSQALTLDWLSLTHFSAA